MQDIVLELVRNASTAVVVGAGWGAANYFYNAKKYGESFEIKKFIPSLGVYILVGVAFKILGVGENTDLFMQVAPMFAGAEGLRFIYKIGEQYLQKEDGD